MKILNFPILKKSISYFFVALLLFQSTGCSYFKVNTVYSDFQHTINEIGEVHKNFIIHHKDQTYSLKNIAVDSTYIHGTLNILDNIRGIKYYNFKSDDRYRSHEKSILNEVHFYVNDNAEDFFQESTSILLSDLQEIRIIEKNTGKTVASYVLTSIGIVASLYALLIIIVALTKSSCPYVYVDDGEGFIFEGETFGGAIGQNMQRDDYMPLPSIQANDGIYRLRISNELKERQYTDVAELMLVSHTEGQKVLLDKTGNPQLIQQLQSSTNAEELGGASLQSYLEKRDSIVYQFNNLTTPENGVVLNFQKPSNTTDGKLVLNAKNTLWFDYAFGEMLKKFGSSFDIAMNRHAALPTDERTEKIIAQEFPLSVFVMKNGSWQLIEYINTVGPLANRDLVIPIDLTDIEGEKVKIKLETGFMFWEVDYVGMDFSNAVASEVTILQPSTAFGTASNNWTEELSKIDGQYMAQENIGDITEIIYNIPPANQQECQSAFLHTSGYYELIRDFEGLPQISELKKFKVPGYFSEYSKQGYLKTITTDEDFFAVAPTN